MTKNFSDYWVFA